MKQNGEKNRRLSPEYEILFDAWNVLKKCIHGVSQSDISSEVFFYEKEVWFASIGMNVGREQSSGNKNFSRPILVIKKFNKTTFLSIPLTSKPKMGIYYISSNEKFVTGSFIISQLSFTDSARLIRKLGVISADDFYKIKRAIKNMI